MFLAPRFKRLKVTEIQKLRGTTVHLKPGDEVIEVTPEDDGWITVKTLDGYQGEIPIKCVTKGLVHISLRTK